VRLDASARGLGASCAAWDFVATPTADPSGWRLPQDGAAVMTKKVLQLLTAQRAYAVNTTYRIPARRASEAHWLGLKWGGIEGFRQIFEKTVQVVIRGSNQSVTDADPQL
jgi:hypothetical protein